MGRDPANAPEDPSVQEAQAVAGALAVDSRVGLSPMEAVRRLTEHGPNELRSVEARPWWRRFLGQFQSSLIYLLIGAVVVALAAWRIEGGEGWPVDALVITAVLLLNGTLGFVQESKAANAVADSN